MNIPHNPELTPFLLATPLPLGQMDVADDILSWQRLTQSLYTRWPTPFERAVVGGFWSQSVGIAFASGYQSALQTLAPGIVDYNAASFCVTEQQGNSPAAIRTQLTSTTSGNWMLSGQKSFVSGAEHAQCLLVAAVLGQDEQQRPQIKVVHVQSHKPGVTITNLPPLSFIPEFSHGAVRFQDVPVEAADLLPGDGYSDYVKPFRTIEDIHVSAALLGYLIQIARRFDWPRHLLEQLLALVALYRTLAQGQPSAPEIHLALAGARQLMQNTLQALHSSWQQCDPAVAAAWQRDQSLLNIASKAHAQRTLRAWEALQSPAP